MQDPAAGLRPPWQRMALVALVAMLALTVAACGRSSDSASLSVPGVTDKEIKVGGSFPFTGPLAVYGAISQGFAAYVDAVNASGGVNGRKIAYHPLDDAYDPS